MAREDVEIAFNLEMETRKLQQQMGLFDLSIKKATKSVDKLGQRGETLYGTSGEFQKNLKKAQQAQGVYDQKARKAQEKYAKVLAESSKEALLIKKQLAAASTEAERDAVQEQLSIIEKGSADILKAARKTAQETYKIAVLHAAKTQKELTKATKIGTSDLAKQLSTIKMPEFSGFAKDLGSELKGSVVDSLGSIKGKDLPGLIKGVSGIVAGALKGGGGYGAALAAKGSVALKEKGEKKGGVAGAGMQVMGKILGQVGPMLGMLAKMGPILSIGAAAFAGIIKLMIDVESQAKQINKELMEGGALADSFAVAGNKTNAAMGVLSETLQDIKDQASDVKMNLSMGTTAKDHYAVINAIKKEGLSLENLKARQEDSRKESEVAAASGQKHLSSLSQGMTQYTGLTSMAVAYSREFGVSLDEIGTLTGELMSELKMSATGMAMEFSRMTDAAVESGFGVTKFFGIIRGVSQDLSLYGMRLKDVTKTLAIMGKTMSANTAKKFMQTLTQGFKGKGMTDRVKTALISGPAGTKATQEDVTEKMGDLLDDVMKTGNFKSKEDAKAALESGEGVEGPQREAYLRLQQRQKSLNSGGALGTAAAMGENGPAAVAETMKAAMLKFGGGKTLKDVTNVGILATENATGYSQEEQLQTMQFFESIEDQKKVLKKLFEKQRKGEKLDAKEQSKLDKAVAAGIKDGTDVDAASTGKMYKTMDKSAEDQAKEAEAQMKVAYESGKLSQSALDKMDVVIDALFNWLYKVLVSIWDTMLDFPGLGGDDAEHEKAKMEIAAGKSRNKELMAMADKAATPEELAQAIKESATMKSMHGALTGEDAAQKKRDFVSAQSKKEEELNANLNAAGNDPKAWEAAAKALSEFKKGKEGARDKAFSGIDAEAEKKKAAATKIANQAVKGNSTLALMAIQGGLAKGPQGGVLGDDNGQKQSAAQKGVAEGKDLDVAMKEAGFNPEEIGKAMAQAAEQMTTTRSDGKISADALKGLTDNFLAYGKEAGIAPGGVVSAAPAAPGATPAPVSAQGASVQKAEAAATPPAPPPSPGAPPGATIGAPAPPQGAVKTAPTEDQVVAKVTEDGAIDVVNSLQDLWKAMRVKGLKLDKTHTLDEMEKGTLTSVRKALFEFAVYSSSDPTKLLDQIAKSGMSEVGTLGTNYATTKKEADAAAAAKAKADAAQAAPHADGGLVTGIQNGMAIVAAPGEGLTSIGKGERILPAGAGGGGGSGGGGGNVTVNVNGIGGADLANYLKGKMAEAIYEYKRREKYT